MQADKSTAASPLRAAAGKAAQRIEALDAYLPSLTTAGGEESGGEEEEEEEEEEVEEEEEEEESPEVEFADTALGSSADYDDHRKRGGRADEDE